MRDPPPVPAREPGQCASFGGAAMRYAVSACLAGAACRYDGGAAPCEIVLHLLREGRALPVCPEQLGGLCTPREPMELSAGRVLTRTGEDRTQALERGAAEAVRLVLAGGCRAAVLKSRSPSCGTGEIYDGTFSGRLVPGEGIFARALRQNGFRIFDETGTPGDGASVAGAEVVRQTPPQYTTRAVLPLRSTRT